MPGNEAVTTTVGGGMAEIRIRKLHGVLTAHGHSYSGDYWVGMRPAANDDPDDQTMEEATPRFVTRKALLAYLGSL